MKSLRKDKFFGKKMNNFLYKNKMLMGGGISLFLTVLFVLLFTTSCNNMIELKGKQGSLSIAVPGGRNATDNLSYTVSITGSAGSSQTKTVPSGQTVTFEELTPGTYTIAVEGKEKVESATTTTNTEKVVSYGTSSATVIAGASASATVTLGPVVSTFEDLQKAVGETGGTVALYGEIEVTEGLDVTKEVTLVASSTGAKIINNDTDAPLFTVSSGGSLTLGDGTSPLTLDGGNKEAYGVEVDDGGTLTMKNNVTIQNAANSGVYVTGTFNMGGGKITGNTAKESGNFAGSGGGVYVNSSGIFNMTGGTITGNGDSSNHGGGVYVNSSGIFNMTGGEISGNTADKGSQVYVTSTNANTKGTFKMGGSATLKGGEVYLYNYTTATPITLTSSLTSSDSPVARITVENYNNSYTKVLQVETGVTLTLADEVGKFTVTPKETNKTYAVNAEGEIVRSAVDTESLKTALVDVGTVYIAKDFDLTEELKINSKDVTLVAISKEGATLTKAHDGDSMFTVIGNFTLTLGDRNNSLTLDGAGLGGYGVYIQNSGKFVMQNEVTIQNVSRQAVNVLGGCTFEMNGGTIKENKNGGVYTTGSAIFTMSGGSIINNKGSNGGGVYLGGTTVFTMSGGLIAGNKVTGSGNGVLVASVSASFKMSGSAIVAGDNDVYLETAIATPDLAMITVSGALDGEGIVARITPKYYSESVPVLKVESGVTLANVVENFAVTTQADGTEWIIDAEGKLQQKQ